MGEGGAVGEGQADLVDPGAGPQADRGGLRTGRDAVDVVVEVAVRAAELIARQVRLVAAPGEAHGDRVVVGEHLAGGVQEVGVLVGVRGRGQRDQRAAAVQDLVDDLAGVGGGVLVAQQRVGTAGRRHAAALQLHPGVGQPVVGGEGGDGVVGPGVARVGVAHHDDGVPGRVGPDVAAELRQVGGAGGLVAALGTRVRVEVVEVHVHALGQPGPHEGEPLGREAVTGVQLTVVPLDPLEVVGVVGETGQGVEAAADARPAAGRRAVRVGVGGVQRGVVVEVLLDVHDVVRREPAADGGGAALPLGRGTVHHLREAGDVVRQHGEGPAPGDGLRGLRGLRGRCGRCADQAAQRGGRAERAHED